MGTSLSGLTPATTFDGLLKTSDNDAITSSLKTIGSGDGTDSCLQLSDSALKVNGGQVTIVGIGNTGATSSLVIENSSASNLLRVNDSGEIRMQTLDFLGNKITSLARINTSGLAINNAGANPDANTQLHVKGSGATSATTSLLVQNSAGDDMLKVTDNGKVGIGGVASPSQSLHINGNIRVNDANGIIYSNKFAGLSAGDLSISTSGNILLAQTGDVGIGQTTPTARLHVKGSDTTSSNYALRIENGSASTLIDARNDGVIRLAPNSNQTALFNNAKINNGNASFGTSTIPASTRVTIKGQGATSATTSLLVQNSAGDDMFKTTDDGGTTLKSFGASNTLILDASSGVSAFQMNSSNGQQRFRIQATSSATRFTPNNSNDAFTFVGNGIYTSSAFDTPSARLHIKGAGNDATTNSLLVENSDGTNLLSLNDEGDLIASQSNGIEVFRVDAGDRMFRVNQSNHSTVDFQFRGTSENNLIRADASLNAVGFGTTNPSARVTIKGSGATSATTALLVQNSAGTDTLKVRDDGQINFNGNIYANADYKSIGRNSLNSIRFAGGETRVSVQGTSSSNKFHVYASSTATSVFSVFTQTQQVGIGNGNTALESTAKLQVDSTTQGFLPPRMTGEQIDAIESPASGLIIYNTTTNKAVCYNGTSWNDMF